MNNNYIFTDKHDGLAEKVAKSYSTIKESILYDICQGKFGLDEGVSVINEMFGSVQNGETNRTELLLDWYLYKCKELKIPTSTPIIKGDEL